MSGKRSIPFRVIWGLAVALTLDTVVQVSWKWVSMDLPDGDASVVLGWMLHHPTPLLVVAFMALQMINWLKLLEHVDLSFAQPITALSYISVCLLSVVWLGEHLGLYQGIGIALIILGVWFIGRTSHDGDGAGHSIALPHELEP